MDIALEQFALPPIRIKEVEICHDDAILCPERLTLLSARFVEEKQSLSVIRYGVCHLPWTIVGTIVPANLEDADHLLRGRRGPKEVEPHQIITDVN
ncbi:MAG TPA: hypothetical protein VGA25_00825 [Burkholderiales bacterium]